MDFPDSEQRDAIEHDLSRGMFVEAGAGTGKTSAMIKRIVALISAGGATIDSVVVITFTEAAAGEMRERLRFALESAVANAKPDVAARCDSAIRGLEDAAIGTIHGFAQRLVQQFAVDVGVPPNFDVQDSVASRMRSDERWSGFLHRLLSSGEGLSPEEQQLVEIATALGLTQRQLNHLALALGATWHRSLPLATGQIAGHVQVDARSVIEQVRAATKASTVCSDEFDKLFRRIVDYVQPWLARLEKATANGDQVDVLETLASAPSLRVSNSGAWQNWGKENLAEIRNLLQTADQQRCELIERPRQWAITGVAAMVARFVQDEAQRRRKTGQLDFHDLLVYAVQATRSPGVVRLLRNTYRYLFVDEFQDTDSLQVELIQALTRSDDNGTPAQLFTVGDPKQSIYRFRGADIEQFRHFRSTTSLDNASLGTNFRTLAVVLEWIDEAFAKMMTDGMSPEWVGLSAAREAVPTSFGSIGAVGGLIEGARASEVREVEATAVVEVMVEAKQQRWIVEDANGHQRGVMYGDMAVLMPTRRGLPALERAFRRASVPYRVESRSLIWATQEVRDVVAILRCIADPRDEVALVAALRTPAFGCGDDDLYSWRKANGIWQYDAPIDETMQSHPVGAAYLRLRALHHRHFSVPVSQFINETIAELQMFELAFARSRRREAWHRLRFVVDRARAWTDDGGSGLQSFVQWISLQEEQSADALESVVPEADDDAVRVMTIHAAKGLEFPMVTIIGLGTKDSNSESARALWSSDGECHLRLGSQPLGWQTPGFAQRDADEAAAKAREQERLLYVAATRARDHLRISLYRSKHAKDTLAQKFEEAIGAGAEYAQPATVESVRAPEQLSFVARKHETRTDQAQRRASVIKEASRSTLLSATAIATEHSGLVGVLPYSTVGSSDSVAIELAERLNFGSAVHAMLQHVDFNAGDAVLNAVARSQAESFGLSHRADDIATSVRLALESPTMQAAIASKASWREVPVYAPTGERVIGGSIDLLYDAGDDLVVVDYKTEDVKGDSERKAALERYELQLRTYAYACRQATGRSARAFLLFISPSSGEATEIEVDCSEAALQDLVDKVLPELG